VAQVRAGADSIIAKPLIFHWFLVGFSKIVDFPLVFDRFWRMVAAGRVEPGPGQIPVRGAFSCHCQMAARHHEIVDYSLVSDPLSQHNGPRAAFPPCLPRAPRPSIYIYYLEKASPPRASDRRSPSRLPEIDEFHWFFNSFRARSGRVYLGFRRVASNVSRIEFGVYIYARNQPQRHQTQKNSFTG
jgi:hypothetical protein